MTYHHVIVRREEEIDSMTSATQSYSGLLRPATLMGFCFSCCRPRRSRSPQVESEPLLASQTSSADSLPEPTNYIQKATDILATLKANKYPSQEQLNQFSQLLLCSEFLDVNVNVPTTGYGPVSDDVKKVVLDLRELVEALLMIGMEKNGE